MRRPKYLGICLLCILLISFASIANARTVNDMEELQNALAEGDTEITLTTGTYYGNLDIDYSVSLLGQDGVILVSSNDAYFEEDVPIIAVHSDGDSAPEVSISNIEFNNNPANDYTSIAVIAGGNVDLTLTDCVISGDFIAGVVATNWDEIFKHLGEINSDFFATIDEEPLPTHLTMNECSMNSYWYAGVALLGQGITADIHNNQLVGNPEFSMISSELAGEALSSQAINTTLYDFLTSLTNPASLTGSYDQRSLLGFPGPFTGIVVANGVDDQVRIYDNTVSSNFFGVITAKNINLDLSQLEELDLIPSAVEAGSGLSLEGVNNITDNVVGITAVGGLDALLLVSADLYADPLPEVYVDSGQISLNDTPVKLHVSGQNINNNMIGALLAGKVDMTFSENVLSGDLIAGMVCLGDFSDSYITDNEFNGITGVSMLFALQKFDISSAISTIMGAPLYAGNYEDPFLIDQLGTLNVSGNTITGSGPIEGVHEFLFSPEQVTGQAIALGQRTADNGPLAILPSTDGPDLDDISLAGIVLLDGARNISIDDNSVTGTLLGITGIDTGIIEDIQNIDITNNTVEGNICGMTLVGAGKIVVPIVEDLMREDFMSAENKLELGDVSGNSFSSNHIGMISALSVKGEIHDNLFDDNALLGMAHIGVGDWLLNEFIPPFIVSGDIYPELDIYLNSITGNGTNQEDRPAIFDEYIFEGITAADFLCGGVLVIDASQGITLSENNIEDNGNFGVLATARAVQELTEQVLTLDDNYILDASNNWWGDDSGPASYALPENLPLAPEEETFFLDPVNGDPADGNGDSLGSFLVGVDGTYYPFTITEPLIPAEVTVLFIEEENTIRFSDWAVEPFAVNSGTSRSSGGGSCGVATFTPSLLLLLAPLALMIGKK